MNVEMLEERVTVLQEKAGQQVLEAVMFYLESFVQRWHFFDDPQQTTYI